MSEFGLHLKQARERRGISLRQIASATKISTVALEALERGDFSRLPGGIFSRAFVRAYAIEVGLDPEETVQQYTELAEAAALSSVREVAAAEITDDDRMFLERQRKAGVWLRVVAVALVIAIGGGIVWWRVSVSRGQAAPAVVNQETLQTPQAPAPVEPTAVATSDAASSTTPSTAAPVSARAVSIQLKADASCWVQVTADGRLVLSRNLSGGESQSFEADREITVQFGNAGAISWTVNGKPAKPLGAPGDVRRATITADTASQFWQ
ncbi:MAG: helix-turn-helix domain-containing protein [Acidobacteria bacterium]|nr:helix-turn-helix domain-containing protein [Acidobacteriota bacterium]